MDLIENTEINFNFILSNYDIIGFGETHHGQHQSAVEQIAKNLYRFRGIFWELPINFQSSVNYFLDLGEFDERFKKYFQGAAKEGKDIETDTTTILKSAKMFDVRVWCIDSSKTQNDEYKNPSIHGYYFLRGESRNEDMFENIVRTVKDDNKKWCILCGYQHLRYGKHFRSGDDTLGSRLKNKYGNKFINICLTNKNQIISEKSPNEFDKYFVHK